MSGDRTTSGAAGAALRHRLLGWYDRNQRELPWRRDRDPYRIWVSEVMLTQTRVETVIPYYQRFLRRFPDLGSLAAARLDEVMKAWEGLGYYARARHLHRTARAIVERHGGELPRTAAELRELPGIGAYTAAAIASIAFGRPEPAIDGNVRRVLSRLHDLAEPTASQLRGIAAPIVADRRPGAVNQALMDLGAAVCRPRDPRCPACPLSDSCLARARGTQLERPAPRPRRRRPHHEIAVGVIWREGEVLIARRPPDGLLGGLWEFPGGKREAEEALPATVVREVREELGIEVRPGRKIAAVEHAYSHFEITLHAFHCRHVDGDPEPRSGQPFAWVPPRRLREYAFPAANRRILERLGSGGPQASEQRDPEE